jgi:hypothetical protein
MPKAAQANGMSSNSERDNFYARLLTKLAGVR